MGRHKKRGVKRTLTDRQRKKNASELNKAWEKEHTKIINFRFNFNTDADILEKLNSVGNKQGYIKELIRNDIKK